MPKVSKSYEQLKKDMAEIELLLKTGKITINDARRRVGAEPIDEDIANQLLMQRD